MSQYQSVVKWFNNATGYGSLGRKMERTCFAISVPTQIEGYKSLTDGDAVTFDIIQGPKGPEADQVAGL